MVQDTGGMDVPRASHGGGIPAIDVPRPLAGLLVPAGFVACTPPGVGWIGHVDELLCCLYNTFYPGRCEVHLRRLACQPQAASTDAKPKEARARPRGMAAPHTPSPQTGRERTQSGARYATVARISQCGLVGDPDCNGPDAPPPPRKWI